jgi:hypothetical protein
MGLEFKCWEPEPLRIEVLLVTIEVQWDKSIQNNPEAIHIGLLYTFSNTNLRKVLLVGYHKYLLLFAPAEAEKLPTCTVFEHKIKLMVEPKQG